MICTFRRLLKGIFILIFSFKYGNWERELEIHNYLPGIDKGVYNCVAQTQATRATQFRKSSGSKHQKWSNIQNLIDFGVF